MANSAIEIPFYVAKDGAALTGAANQMNFEFLRTISGADKSAAVPVISEIGGGWYKFSAAYGVAAFDAGDLVGVIDADKDGVNTLANAERYIPVEVRLDFYGLMRNVCTMTQNKLTGDMEIKDSNDATILTLKINDSTGMVERNPE
ncbi:MAG: hypothetical protein A2Y12_10805 [Planctomycetes bacterium GWF2_42_9]|nr:MAG: hypothetical protein A2Y12_10805 [Planctomycetes bacterium GWF2_42_9]HAL45741.1 hypothetical protein [Phycisphaerales bacterium]